jgi:hypothetical protein
MQLYNIEFNNVKYDQNLHIFLRFGTQLTVSCLLLFLIIICIKFLMKHRECLNTTLGVSIYYNGVLFRNLRLIGKAELYIGKT